MVISEDQPRKANVSCEATSGVLYVKHPYKGKFSSFLYTCLNFFLLFLAHPYWPFLSLLKLKLLKGNKHLNLYGKKWKEPNMKHWSLKLKVKQRMLSDLFVRDSHEEMSWCIDQTFIHLHFRDVAFIPHDTQQITIQYDILHKSSLVSSSAVLLQPLENRRNQHWKVLLEKRAMKVQWYNKHLYFFFFNKHL